MMLGKSVRASLLGFALCVLVVGCARNVPQDSKSGGDAKIKGAKAMTMENGEAKATGIVTYPGGDRVDWKLIEIPDKKKGKLDVKLQWTTPRPKLQLAFDVFDEWNQQVAGSKKLSKKKARTSGGRTKEATIENAHGKYFIRVYAVGRGDAGKYKLTVSFEERAGALAFDPLKLAINDPPKLADVPGIEQGCDEFTFDVKVQACKMVCGPGAPPGWPGCKGKCPTPPTVDEPSCWATMPCPRGAPDERIKACKAKDWPPCPDKNNPDESNPNCRVKAAPIMGRVIGKTVQGSDIFVQVGVGSDQGIKKGWSATISTGPSLTDRAFPGGDSTIVRIDKSVTVIKTRLTADQVDQNKNVRFSPP